MSGTAVRVSAPSKGRAGDEIFVLFVIDSLAAGGAETSTVLLLPRLVERETRVEVAVLVSRGGLEDAVETRGITLHRLGSGESRTALTRELCGLIRRRAPDLVHTTLYESDVCGRTAARLTGVPVVSTLAAERYGTAHVDAPHLNRAKVRAAQMVDLATARWAARLHAVSRTVAEAASQRLRYPRERIDVIPRGRDRSLLGQADEDRRDVTRAGLGIRDESLILAVARQDHVKGLDVLVEAMDGVVTVLPDAHLIVAGRPGDQTASLECCVSKLGLDASVSFLGHRNDVADLLVAADAFVLPSRREGAPGALLEAMALRSPIVASDIAAVREIVDDSMATLVAPERPELFASAILGVLSDVDGARRRADRAEERFGVEYSMEAVAGAMGRFHRRALQRGSALR